MTAAQIATRTVHATRTPYIRHYATTGGVGMAYGPRGYLYELSGESIIRKDTTFPDGTSRVVAYTLADSSVVEFGRKVAKNFGKGARIIITDANTGEQIERVTK